MRVKLILPVKSLKNGTTVRKITGTKLYRYSYGVVIVDQTGVSQSKQVLRGHFLSSEGHIMKVCGDHEVCVEMTLEKANNYLQGLIADQEGKRLLRS